MMNEHGLTDRQQSVLRFLIEEYVDAGRAVGSRTLTEHYPLSVSSATVRNDMAVLERMGYIKHPHRSSGGVPTDRGFRFYVENYAASSRLPTSDQLMIRHQFRQVETQLDSWMQLAASVLAEVAGNLSVVTSPRNRTARLRHFEVLSLSERRALLILVTQDSSVTQSTIHFDTPVDQRELSAAADRLNQQFENKTVAGIRSAIGTVSGIDRMLGDQLIAALQANESGERTELRHEGVEYIVQQPEFTSDDNLHQIFSLLRGGTLLSVLLPQLSNEQDVQIFIGEENTADILQSYGIVVASYGIDQQVTGLLGIVGPRRMQYRRSISSVRYMADLMSDLMRDLYYQY